MKKLDLRNNIYGMEVPFGFLDASISVLIGNVKLADEFTGVDHGDKVEFDGYFDEKKTVIYLGNIKDISLIAHESVHAVFYLTERHGIFFEDTNGKHEIVAYMIGYLVDYIAKNKV